jgi:hypothetical protein
MKDELRDLITSSGWGIMKEQAENIIKEYRELIGKKESDFETIWNMARQEGKVEGVIDLINKIEKMAE